MTKQFNRGDEAVFYATFLSEDGSDSPVVVNPKITIKHFDGNSVVTDVSDGNLIQDGSTNQYYFVFDVLGNAFIGTYLVIYNVNIDGKDVEADESFQVRLEDAQRGGGIS